jgi:hypothetical protein
MRKPESFAPVGKEAWMKLKVVLAALLAVLGCAPLANADPVLLINGSGMLTGARNVDVGGTLYDVTFVDGTCIDVFAGCDAASHFNFATFAEAAAAANALLGQVFIDGPAGNFDTHPDLTFGCTDPFVCAAAIPTGITTGGGVVPGGVVFGALAYNAVSGNLVTNFNFLQDFDTSASGNVNAQVVWAKFTAAQPVPEPASLMLLGSGLAIVRRRRRRVYDSC